MPDIPADAGRRLYHAVGMDEARLIRAAQITVRRAICERFPPGPERRAWLQCAALLWKSREDVLDTVVGLRRPGHYSQTQGARFEVQSRRVAHCMATTQKAFEAHLCADEHCRQVWTLKDLEDRQVKQIAQMVLLAGARARTRNSRARRSRLAMMAQGDAKSSSSVFLVLTLPRRTTLSTYGNAAWEVPIPAAYQLSTMVACCSTL